MDQGDRIASPWERKGIGSSGNTGRFSVGLAATNDEAEPSPGRGEYALSLEVERRRKRKMAPGRKNPVPTAFWLYFVLFSFLCLGEGGGGREVVLYTLSQRNTTVDNAAVGGF